MMENVQKIKIKLENIWIDLIRSIYAPYIFICDLLSIKAAPLLYYTSVLISTKITIIFSL